MNTKVADIFKEQIQSLNFIDVLAGLVRPVIKYDEVETGDGQIVRVRNIFPVACNVSADECEQNDLYYSLAPDSTKRSVIYFEDGGSSLIGVVGDRLEYESKLRLVCWINMNRFVSNECTLSAEIISSLLTSIRSDVFNDEAKKMQRIHITPKYVLPKTAQIFSQYGYKEEISQYLLYPYDYFAIDFGVKFSIHKNCIDEIQIKNELC